MSVEIHTPGLSALFDRGPERALIPNFSVKATAKLPSDVRKALVAAGAPAQTVAAAPAVARAATVAFASAKKAGASHNEAAAVAHAAARKLGASAAAAAAAVAVAQKAVDATPRSVRQQAEHVVKKQAHEVRKRAEHIVTKKADDVRRKTESLIKNQTSAVPAVVRHEAEKVIKKQTAEVRKEAEKVIKQQTSAIRKEAEKVVKQGAGAAAKAIGANEAKKIVEDTFKGMKVPGNIPFQLPKELSAEGVADAAYNTGRVYTENLIQSKIGVHIDLPRKLTVKEISRTVDSLIPDNAREALDMVLTVGSQAAAGAAASALTGVLAATAIGSAVPGLGTIIGLGVGLATVALKGAIIAAFGETACERNKALCKCKTPAGWNCPKIGKRSPVEMLPWIAQEQHKLSKIVRTPALCGLGAVPECENWLGVMASMVFPYVGNTLPLMGLPALEKLLPVYESAAKLNKRAPGYSQQGNAAGLILYGYSGSTNSLGFSSKSYGSLLESIRARVAFLRSLVANANAVDKMSATDVSALRFKLATELGNAGVQYSYDQSATNKAWFETLGKLFAKLEAAESKNAQASAKQQKAGEKLSKERMKDPAWVLIDERASVNFQCTDGCPTPALQKRYDELRRMPASAFVPTVR